MDSQISYDCYDLPLRIVLVVFAGFGSNSNVYDSTLILVWFVMGFPDLCRVQEQLSTLNQLVHKTEKEKEELEARLMQKEREEKELEARLVKKEKEREGLEACLVEKEREGKELEAHLVEKEREGNEIKAHLVEKEREGKELEARLVKKEREGKELEARLLEKEREGKELESRLVEKEREGEELEARLVEKENDMQRLQRECSAAREELQSMQVSEWIKPCKYRKHCFTGINASIFTMFIYTYVHVHRYCTVSHLSHTSSFCPIRCCFFQGVVDQETSSLHYEVSSLAMEREQALKVCVWM